MWSWLWRKRITRQRWSLDLPLGALSPSDPWLLSNAVCGTLAMGSTGSGKTSGFMAYAIRQLLKSGMGGCLLCVKRSDRIDMERFARECGRERDLVIFEPGGNHRLNLLQLELEDAGSSPVRRIENGVQLFRIMLEIAERDRGTSGGSGDNKYFERASLQLLRAVLFVLAMAREPITLENIQRFIMSAPRSLEEASNPAWRERSYCYQTLCRADDQTLDASLTRDFETSLLYCMQEFPAMDPKPRGSIVSTYTTMADLFQRGDIRDTFFGEATITPAACREGKIFVFDFPTLYWNELGRIAQGAAKFVWQRFQERCTVVADTAPVFLISDECQQFLTSWDASFQATARSSRVCTLYATQNLPGMYESVGGESGRHAIDALLGNLRLKIFHAQDDAVTCQWQSELMGKTKRLLFNSSTQPNHAQPFDFFSPPSNVSAGFSESWEYEVQPWEWSRDFRTGGPQHGFQVDGIAYQGGRLWNATGKPYLPVVFTQR